jgi:cation diffusion facilitator family transporter
MTPRESLTRFAWLSIAAALATIALKGMAWWLTGSVGLLSDALESFVNLAAAILALWLLKVAALPPDEEHTFGHGKAEYFASGIEGTLIFAAAAGIVVTALPRLMHPEPLEQVGWGLAVSSIAALVNLVVGRIT